MMNNARFLPRVLVAGTNSGCGKTTIVCGLLSAMKRRGLPVRSFKCGPDYIDPLFHQEILGIPSMNLDPWFFPEKELQFILNHFSKENELAVLEGVMGYYDGIGFSSRCSTKTVAQATKTPVILVVDCKGAGLSAMATVEGFLRFEEDTQIRGVIFNRMAPSLYPEAADYVRRLGLLPLGYLPYRREIHLESRHLGLVTPDRRRELGTLLEQLGHLVAETVDIDNVMGLALGAEAIEAGTPDDIIDFGNFALHFQSNHRLRIAQARDEAFCFFYPQDNALLEAFGCEIVPFSPVDGEGIPRDIQGLILPGGYPELYAGEIAANTVFLRQVREAFDKGLPLIAECGGFMVLHQELETAEGKRFPMAGVIEGRCFPKKKLGRFGYITARAQRKGLLAMPGETLLGHEFHYWESTACGDAFKVEKASGASGWEAGHMQETYYAGFPHLPLSANRAAARRFVEAARCQKPAIFL